MWSWQISRWRKCSNRLQHWKNDGLRVQPRTLDIVNSERGSALFDDVVNDSGRLDILVNNTGLGQNMAPVVELTDQEWERALSVTLTGPFYCCRAAARIMERQESGAIVNIASIDGQNPAAWWRRTMLPRRE